MFYLLQKGEIATIIEYLDNIEEDDNKLAILNDLLETEYFLISYIINESESNSDWKTYLFTCFSNFVRDAIENPTVFKNNFVIKLDGYLDEQQLKALRIQILKIISNSMESEPSTIFSAITNQPFWNEEFSQNKFEFIKKTMLIICQSELKEVLELLMDRVVQPEFDTWKFYVNILTVLLEGNLTNQTVDGLKGKLFCGNANSNSN